MRVWTGIDVFFFVVFFAEWRRVYSSFHLGCSGAACFLVSPVLLCVLDGLHLEPTVLRSDSEGHGGLHYVLKTILHLLDPLMPEFSASFVGKLIIVFIKKVVITHFSNGSAHTGTLGMVIHTLQQGISPH